MHFSAILLLAIAALAATDAAAPFINPFGGGVHLEAVTTATLTYPMAARWRHNTMIVAELSGRFSYVPHGSMTPVEWFNLADVVPELTTANGLGVYNFLLKPKSNSFLVFYTIAGPNVDVTAECNVRNESMIHSYIVVSEFQANGFVTPTKTRDIFRVAMPVTPSGEYDVGGALEWYSATQLLVSIGADDCRVGISDPRATDNFIGKVLIADYATGALTILSRGVKNVFQVSRGVDGTWYASDCGDDLWEEVNVLSSGRDFGFPQVNGYECVVARGLTGGAKAAAQATCRNSTAPSVVYNRIGDGSCISSVIAYSGHDFPCLRFNALVMTDLTGRNYAGERDGTLLGHPYLFRGILSIAGTGDIEAKDNNRIRLKVSNDFLNGHPGVYQRLFAGPGGELYVMRVAEFFTGSDGLVARVRPDPEAPLCLHHSSSSSSSSSSS